MLKMNIPLSIEEVKIVTDVIRLVKVQSLRGLVTSIYLTDQW